MVPEVDLVRRRTLMKRLLKSMIPASWIACLKVIGRPGGYHILPKAQTTYAQDLLYTEHNADFMRERSFAEAYRLGTQTDAGQLLKDGGIHWRVHVICWAAWHARHLAGDFVDCGVNTGMYARAVIHYVDFQRLGKTYYLLDTFSGMDPRYSSPYEMRRNDILGYGRRAGVYEQVQETFKDYNVAIIRGAVPDTLPLVKSSRICFLSVDMNAVLPEVAALEFFWDRLVKGGIIVLDDYGYPGCLEQKEAHDHFAASKGVKVLSLPTCQGLILKP